MSFFVLFIHGPAAAGKLTIGKKVSERLGLPLFHNHLTVDLVKALFEFGTTPFNTLRADIWRSSFRIAAVERRSFVFTFNPEATVQPELIDELTGMITEAGGQVHYVELRCSDAEVARRLGNVSRRQYGKLTDASLYREVKDRGGFDFPALPDPLVSIDTERKEPEEAAATIVNAVLARS